MKKLICIIVVLSIGCQPLMATRGLKITHIANEGFLLDGGDKKVIIDGIFGPKELGFCDTPPANMVEKLKKAQAPFDRVDLILITHAHVDHVDASLVNQFLEHNTTCHLVGTDQVIVQLRAASQQTSDKQLHAITPDPGQSKTCSFNGVDVEVFRLKHCDYFVTDKQTGKKINRHANMQNVGYVVHIGDQKILHIGDNAMDSEAEFANYDFAKMNLDVAMLGSLVWKPVDPKIDLVNRIIRPKHIILMHLNKGSKDKYVNFIETHKNELPPVTLFRELMEVKNFD